MARKDDPHAGEHCDAFKRAAWYARVAIVALTASRGLTSFIFSKANAPPSCNSYFTMSRRSKRTRGIITPSFPSLRDDLIPQTVKGEAPQVTAFSAALPGIDWRTIPAGEQRAFSRLADDLYARYMRSERWRINRQPALDRAHGCCERCGRRDTLEVHHLTYERFTRELPQDLRALCTICHPKADRERKAAWAAMLAHRRAEAAEELEERRFDGFMRADTQVEDWEHNFEPEEIDEMRERFERWSEDRDEQ